MSEFESQKQLFLKQVFPSQPNEWEVDEVFEQLAPLGSAKQEVLLGYVEAIWPVSHSLCFSYLQCGVRAMEVLSIELVGDWVRNILQVYEQKGLVGARLFMEDVTGNFLARQDGESSVSFEQVATPMSHYLRGIGGRGFEVLASSVPYTDIEVIYLPHLINLSVTQNENRLLYKLIASLLCAQVQLNLFAEVAGLRGDGIQKGNLQPDEKAEFDEVHWGGFGDQELARQIIKVLQFVQGVQFLKNELPGLITQSEGICKSLIDTARKRNAGSVRACYLFELLGTAFDDEAGANCSIVVSLLKLYGRLEKVEGPVDFGEVAILLGTFHFDSAVRNLFRKRMKEKNRFVAMLARLLASLGEVQGHELQVSDEGPVDLPVEEIAESLLMLIGGSNNNEDSFGKNHFLLNNESLKVPDELLLLSSEIYDDLGTIPDAYVQAAAGIGGSGFHREGGSGKGCDTLSAIQAAGSAANYDEWDFRRNGYRKDWCTLYEKSLKPVRSSFILDTLEKYSPQLLRLRRQFEMLRVRERFMRRQRHGDDIDLDALMDALGDDRAGRSPSDRLFVRLLRDDRDISTLFLVDMSNSTEGWVGVAIKEALVLLSEALEVVGDQYGIYGFSGMRRSKSEVYHVKHIDEALTEEVKQRIPAIIPMEYTRMGPAIRHMSSKLLDMQSKVRLLLVISDGKPEDYDDYKGKYAIEDTKRALLEARGMGINPFCITIDKAAQEYLGHMFGVGNYLFINKISSLPEKITKMYRTLTR